MKKDMGLYSYYQLSNDSGFFTDDFKTLCEKRRSTQENVSRIKMLEKNLGCSNFMNPRNMSY